MHTVNHVQNPGSDSHHHVNDIITDNDSSSHQPSLTISYLEINHIIVMEETPNITRSILTPSPVHQKTRSQIVGK